MQPAVKCGKMDGTTPRMSHLNLIAWRSDLLTEHKDGAILATQNYPLCPPKNIYESYIINPLLTKPVWSRCLDVGLILFLQVCGP